MSPSPAQYSSRPFFTSRTGVSAVLVACALVGATFVATPAHANERHFTYTYESATLPAGAVELEPWTTVRAWKDDYYLRFDHRLEFELGLTDNLLAAFY